MKAYLLMFQHKLDVLVCHGNEICTYQCHHNKNNSRLIDVHLINPPKQPWIANAEHFLILSADILFR